MFYVLIARAHTRAQLYCPAMCSSSRTLTSSPSPPAPPNLEKPPADRSVWTMLFARVSFLPTLAYNMVMRHVAGRDWWSRIDDTVVLGALPLRHQVDQLLSEEKIGAVVSMNEDYELKFLSMMNEDWVSRNIRFLQLSITDIFEAPCQKKLWAGVRFIEQHRRLESNRKEGGSVYVHCKAGRTRSATLVGCYLMKRNGWNSEQAVDYMRSKRHHILLGPKQWQALRQFEQTLFAEHVTDGATSAVH